ncbi:MAG: hypothetical protein MJK11_19845 [Pseudomonadales bacterium]|uniref:hypothetical protein n=1 Tax=Moritella sp. TaxID=78556 RepID=UPI001D4B14C3|nr:hypothetical protein [Moritella sp.]MCJ8315211.1 hypothetical protein [Pseudomonadales bacterium]NQZ49357.1 hypothetical protein [Moritella sp.]
MNRWVKSAAYLGAMCFLSLLIVFTAVMVNENADFQVIFFYIRIAMYPIGIAAFHFYLKIKLGEGEMTPEIKYRVRRLQIVLVILFVAFEIIQVMRGSSL